MWVAGLLWSLGRPSLQNSVAGSRPHGRKGAQPLSAVAGGTLASGTLLGGQRQTLKTERHEYSLAGRSPHEDPQVLPTG